MVVMTLFYTNFYLFLPLTLFSKSGIKGAQFVNKLYGGLVMYTTVTDILTALETRIQERHLLKHPFYQAWSAGALSLSALQEYSKQYYRQVEAFPTYVSAVHANCPHLPVRQQLLENLLEEERGADNHPELWLRFAGALGVHRNDVTSAAPLPEISALIQTFRT